MELDNLRAFKHLVDGTPIAIGLLMQAIHDPQSPASTHDPRQFKRRARTWMVLLALVPGCIADDPADIDTSEVALTVGAGQLKMAVGESTEVHASVSTASATALYTLGYKSSSTAVATVTSDGVVKAVANGQATITVTATLLETGTTASASVAVIVGDGTAPSDWTFCANENAPCAFSGTKEVRYGANGTFTTPATFSGGVSCTNTVFGDPVVGATKYCETRDTSTTPTGTVVPTPTNIANGATVSLQCGTTYQGALNLNGKSDVTVKTVGTCGKASITPGAAVTGWTVHQGAIYSAPISFVPVQVAVDGTPASAAHWPNAPWATSTSSLPSTDLNGATLVYRDNDSVIKTQLLTSNSVSTAKPFYVEGKLWMLDSPGEWAVQNGRLYLWAPNGQSPQGRVWAAAAINGINADYSTRISVENVRIFSASNGISANTSVNLKVIDSEIVNSALDGIWASGSEGLTVTRTNVSNARASGIDGWYWVVGATITDSTVSNTGMVGMPTPTGAGIFFGDGSGNRIDNVRVTNSSYHGISVLHNRDTTVINSLIDGACVRLTDCGGIYTGARDQLPLTLKIQNNTVRNVLGTQGIAIYLDDFSNGVTVTGNTMSNNTRAMVLHNAFNNVITTNTFTSNKMTQLAFGQDSPGAIRNNQVNHNTFNSTNGEHTYNLETGSNLKTFATIDYNTYTSNNVGVFGRTWDGSSPGVTTSYTAWKAWSVQDAHSTMNGSP
ncbi:MAG: right-handed parallel beta-helix repeat-containing protein [Myxococcales bacterium]|nr:right-handed parallel beta-helix repeat-containing protein [Myxococcales bacterium]